MTRSAPRLPALLVLAVTATWPASAAASAPPAPRPSQVTISGSETTGALVADLIHFYRAELRRRGDPVPRFSLTFPGTAAGISDVFTRVTEIGLAARDRIADDPRILRFTPIAISGVCVVTNRANPVSDLSSAQIRQIAAGTLALWSAVRGATRADALDVWRFPPREGAQLVFERTFLGATDDFTAPARQVPTSSLMRRELAARANAFGFLDVAYTAGLNVVRVDGIACDRNTVRTRVYPARRRLNLVTRGRSSPAAMRFIAWVRSSATARRVIATRYVPAS